jgi:hypothetical protein
MDESSQYSEQATGWMVRSWNPGSRETFFSSPNVQTGSGTHPDSYSMGTNSSPEGKEAGA